MAVVKKITSMQSESSATLRELLMDELKGLGVGEVALVYFTGKREGLEEWCHDCMPASIGFDDFAANYQGPVRLFSAYVGSKEDWKAAAEGVSPPLRTNAFMSNIPKIAAVPSVGIYVNLQGMLFFAGWHMLPDSKDPADYNNGFQLEAAIAEYHYVQLHR